MTTATIHTTLGDIAIELCPNHAPKTVANFIGLADGSISWMDPKTGKPGNGPLYTNVPFHRVIADTMWLNFKHTIFGKVIDDASRKVVDAIATAPTGAQDRPKSEILIKSITISE